jgi:hypothetical protein
MKFTSMHLLCQPPCLQSKLVLKLTLLAGEGIGAGLFVSFKLSIKEIILFSYSRNLPPVYADAPCPFLLSFACCITFFD